MWKSLTISTDKTKPRKAHRKAKHPPLTAIVLHFHLKMAVFYSRKKEKVYEVAVTIGF